MAVDPVGWVTAHPALVVTGLLAAVALAWAYEAAEEADDGREAVEGFGGRLRDRTGGAVNVAGVSLVAATGWAATTFRTFGEAAAFVLSLAPEAPVLSASIFTIALGGIGLSDLIVLRAWHFVGLATATVIFAVAFRTNFGDVEADLE